MLLHYVGEEVFDIYTNIFVPGTDENFTNAVEVLDNHFKPKANISYEIYKFRNLKQQTDETTQQFYIRVKEHAMKCEFDGNLEKEIKQQIELSTNNNKLRRYSFRNPGLNLKDFLTYARTLEETGKEADDVEQKVHKNEEINAVKDRRYTPKTGKNKYTRSTSSHVKKPCYFCGGEYPHPKTRPCPATNKTCNNCKKSGHFARCCRSKPGIDSRPHQSRNRGLNHVTTCLSHNSDEEFIFALHEVNENIPPIVEGNSTEYISDIQTENVTPIGAGKPQPNSEIVYHVNTLSQFEVSVQLEKQPVRFLIDSGAAVNVLTQETFNKLNHHKSLKITKSATKILTYGSKQPMLRVLGTVQLLIETERLYATEDFFVVDTKSKNLLSGNTALKLNLISLPPEKVSKEINATDAKNVDSPSRLQHTISRFKSTLFNGKVGKIKGFQTKLHIDDKVPPSAQRERRIPFALREKVKRELERLEQEDIIEDVTSEPTPWLSPLVVVPKANSESIRLCLDMRKANTAIGRTRYPTPTVEDLLIKLKGCDRFSKLDLNSAFYQLELSPESRYITAFQSEDRIKRFKRLIFGANSASEELQNVLRVILSDIDGAMNIADDILIFAKGTKSHDAILLKVFKTLESYGVTLNLQKCLFDKENLDFYGYMFSRAGMQPSTSKVSALKNAKQPETCNDVRSFLGMVNYLKRFIPDFSTLTYPLRQLTKKDTIFSWTEECVESFTINSKRAYM